MLPDHYRLLAGPGSVREQGGPADLSALPGLQDDFDENADPFSPQDIRAIADEFIEPETFRHS
jgi:acetyl esterase/lipase